jgi:peptidoglycan/xylan/chitin deacetylase (PgdA/CDA1 family)
MMPLAEVATLAYHEIADDPTRTGFQRPGARRFLLSPSAFRRTLDEVATSPWKPELVTAVELSRPGRHVLLSFDDGGKSACLAADELARRGWRGHFFIITSLIGTRTFLSAREIRELHGSGHLIGSHSHTHPNIFRELSPTQMLAEWRTSAARLSDLLGAPCLAASVPGGDISRTVLESADRAGFRHLWTIEPQLRPHRVEQCWILGRFSVRPDTAPARVRNLVHFRGWTRARMVRHAKVLARRALPPVYRAIVARRTRDWEHTG